MFTGYCKKHGIKLQHSSARTPQQNEVVERKNRAVMEMARTMLIETNTSKRFWKEAVVTVVYNLNRCMFRPYTNQTPFELWFERKPSVKYFKVFGSKCFIKNKKENLGKFEDRADERIFLGYVSNGKGYTCYNKWSQKIVTSSDVKVAEYGVYTTAHDSEDEMSDDEEVEVKEVNLPVTPKGGSYFQKTLMM